MKAAIFACWFAATAAVGAAGYAAGYDHGIRDEGVSSQRDMDQLVLAMDALNKWVDSWHDVAEVLRYVTTQVADPTCGGKFPSLRVMKLDAKTPAVKKPETKKPAQKSVKRARGTVAKCK